MEKKIAGSPAQLSQVLFASLISERKLAAEKGLAESEVASAFLSNISQFSPYCISLPFEDATK